MIFNLLEILNQHKNVSASLSFGDLSGVTLCYNDMHYDVIGEAPEELDQIRLVPGRLSVSGRFWSRYI